MHNLKLKVNKTTFVTPKNIKIDFDVVSPSDFTFKGGQHINIMVGDNLVRPYSICSDPVNPSELSIVVSVGHEGSGSKYLKELKKGAEVSAVGPAGKLSIKTPMKENLVFVATGTGVCPFIADLYELAAGKVLKNIKLYFGVINEEERFFIDELEEFRKVLPFFEYDLCLSKPSKEWQGNKGRVTEFVKFLAPKDTQVYICGHRDMVSEVKKLAIEAGVSEEDIIG